MGDDQVIDDESVKIAVADDEQKRLNSSSEGGTQEQYATFDDIYKVIGEFGKFQKIIYLMFSVTYIMTAMQLLGWVFVGVKLPVRCRYPFELNMTDEEKNSPSAFADVSFLNSTSSTARCSYIWNGINSSTCDLGFVYDTSNVKDSAIKEWNLVCENEGI